MVIVSHIFLLFARLLSAVLAQWKILALRATETGSRRVSLYYFQMANISGIARHDSVIGTRAGFNRLQTYSH